MMRGTATNCFLSSVGLLLLILPSFSHGDGLVVYGGGASPAMPTPPLSDIVAAAPPYMVVSFSQNVLMAVRFFYSNQFRPKILGSGLT